MTESIVDRIKRGICPNCGGRGPHYVPPSCGDPGFYACEAINKLVDGGGRPTGEATGGSDGTS